MAWPAQRGRGQVSPAYTTQVLELWRGSVRQARPIDLRLAGAPDGIEIPERIGGQLPIVRAARGHDSDVMSDSSRPSLVSQPTTVWRKARLGHRLRRQVPLGTNLKLGRTPVFEPTGDDSGDAADLLFVDDQLAIFRPIGVGVIAGHAPGETLLFPSGARYRPQLENGQPS